MSRRPGLLAQREQGVNRPGLAPACAGAPGELACPLQRAGDRVGGIVGGDALGAQDHLRVEPAFEKELGRVVTTARERSEQVDRGGLLTALAGDVLGQTPERREVRVAIRERSARS